MPENVKKPAIRFAGFDDAWEQRKLIDKVDVIGTGKSKFLSKNRETEGNPYAILGSTSVIGYDKDYDYSGDFVLTARVGANAGDLYRYSGNVKISDNTVFLQGQDLDFIFFLLTRFNLKTLSFGTGQPLIKASELSNLELMFPKQVEENKQIAKFFNQVDNLITLHQRKYDKLVSVKKSMLEKMFPKNGSDIPEIRFAGFTDPWEQRKLIDIVDRITETSNKIGLPRVEYEDINSGLGTLNKDLSGKYSNKQGVLFRADDVLFGKLRPYLKNWLIADFSGIAVGDFWVLRGFETDSSFIYTLIQSDVFDKVANQSTGTKMPRADWSLVSNAYFEVPHSKAEQHQIGTFFHQLDNLITLHQRKLEKLKNVKKSMLERMFV